MARRARKKSQTGIYHVILRGINRQIIFEDNEDYQKLLETLKECQEKSGCEIYAYCLMSNHIHLLLKEGNDDLGIIFRRLVQAMCIGTTKNMDAGDIYFRADIKVK